MGKILIGADFVPTQSNELLFGSGNLEELFGKELLSILSDAECRIFNLEMPLTARDSPLEKCGPALRGKPETVKTYHNLHVDLLTLANNHIMDQGEEGLNDTIKVLTEHGIHYVGAGKDLTQAQEPYIIHCNNGKKIGVYACTEHEFSVAEANKPGANPFDSYESFDHVNHLEDCCDYVIVLYHGGKEFYRYPSPLLQKTCRKFIEKGANLVITQHSHCVGSQETYQGGCIVYGQGNFLFDGGKTEFWRTGILISLDTDSFSCEWVPVVKNDSTVRLANATQKKEILDDLLRRSEEIKSPGFVDQNYRVFAAEKIEDYLTSLYGIGEKNLVFRFLNKLTSHKYQSFVLRKRYEKKECLALENYIVCEAHNELLIEGIKQFREK